ncbi:hypothetical protein [Nitratireductor pacificus]|uniref:Uncharacterized protein n=1 Tax=Nitratireductor pacificus pht-3B TaxID=391937 RepID=K2MA58_9HYPH|nr:hypothetical protein [Nitratireductor pacificus]EKF17890.1 hypothetical protein NA2_15519 [Nitratireductor pacificus pht-3B]
MFRSILKGAILFLGLSAAGPASAEAYRNNQTDHFGFATARLAEHFSLKTMCTVSGGTIQDRLEIVTRFLPDIGVDIGELVKTAALADGEALCGLKHYRGKTPASFNARTKGFKLDIRTWRDGKRIGGDSPMAACSRFFVNKTGLCYELVDLGDNEKREKADGVSACIETELPDGGTVSMVIYAGSVPETVSAQTHDDAKAIQSTECAQRDY